MDEHAGAEIVSFGGFRFDRRRGLLSRQDKDGGLVPVAIGSRALDVLGLLIDRQGDLVSRDEILDTVWPGVVEGANVTVQISALRRALDDGRSDGSLIQTIPGRGYRLAAAITRCEADPLAAVGSNGADRGGDEFAPAPSTPIWTGLRVPDWFRRSELPGSSAPIAMPYRRYAARTGIAATAATALVLAVGAWWLWPTTKPSPTLATATATSIAQPLLAPRLSIVVLPFADLSDRGQQYFVDGITEDLTMDLSRIADMLVISRNTAFTYKGKAINAKEIGRELGVRYLLEGSVQRSGERVRVSAQLIDAETAAYLWTERFDREIDDVFRMQNEITSRIAVALHQELVDTEATRPSDHPDALDYILRARAAWNKPPSREKWGETISHLESALAIDPGSVAAQGWLASALAARVMDRMADSPEADITRAERLAGQALAAAPRSSLAHYAWGHVLRAQGRHEQAIPEYERVLALNRNWVFALSALAQSKLATGSIEEAIPLQEQAIRISPRDPSIGMFYHSIGIVHLLQSRTDEAIVWLEKARTASPAHPSPHVWLAAAYALKDKIERAASELAEARRLSSDGYPSIARLRARSSVFSAVPKIQALVETTFYAGLRKLGMPEE